MTQQVPAGVEASLDAPGVIDQGGIVAALADGELAADRRRQAVLHAASTKSRRALMERPSVIFPSRIEVCLIIGDEGPALGHQKTQQQVRVRAEGQNYGTTTGGTAGPVKFLRGG